MGGNMKKFLVLFFLSGLLAACTPSTSAIQTPLAATMAAIPTQTDYPTLTPYATLTAYPTYTPVDTQTPWIILVTGTSTSQQTPLEGSTPTPTPTVNPQLTTDKTAGVWIVGDQIAVGWWRSSGDCYANTYNRNGGIIDTVFGTRGIINVAYNAYSVEFVDYPGTCTWSYLGR
jgi:hypothetical protein